MQEKEPIVFKAGFELVGPPRRSGLTEARLDPETGDLLSISLLGSDPLSEQEKGEVLANVSDLLTQVGADLVRQFHEHTAKQAVIDVESTDVTEDDPSEVSH